VTKCLQLIGPETEIPDFDTNVSMSARYKVASQVAQAVMVYCFTNNVALQLGLYVLLNVSIVSHVERGVQRRNWMSVVSLPD